MSVSGEKSACSNNHNTINDCVNWLSHNFINRSISKTIKDKSKHNKFILFHNGITVVCHKAEIKDSNKLEITNYSVVNGCQSTLTLFENRNFITDNLQIMVKVVATGENTKLSDEYASLSYRPLLLPVTEPFDKKSKYLCLIDSKKEITS